MCEQATLRDAVVRALCGDIVETQRREIHQMEWLIGRR